LMTANIVLYPVLIPSSRGLPAAGFFQSVYGVVTGT
jgi:hypothetical protein